MIRLTVVSLICLLRIRLLRLFSIVGICLFCAVYQSFAEEYRVDSRSANSSSIDVERVENEMNEITHIFFGTLKLDESDMGETPVLYNIRAVIGSVSDTVALPVMSISLDKDNIFPVDSPLRYVQDHRYLIVLKTPGKDTRVGSVWPLETLVKIVDIDESEIDRAWRIACISEGTLSKRFCRSTWLLESKKMTDEVLQAWIDFFNKMVLSVRGLKASEVIGVLGRPSYIMERDETLGVIEMYFLVPSSGEHKINYAEKHESTKYMSICIETIDDQVRQVSVRPFGISEEDVGDFPLD